MVLKKIVAYKIKELNKQKKKVPFERLKKLVLKDRRKINSLSEALKRNTCPNLICEMKKASPSEGLIRKNFKPLQILKDFERGGVSGISILTEQSFFKGSPRYLQMVRRKTNKPILRKDFIVDEYQLYESKLMGADVILLIVSILPPKKLKSLTQLAKYLGLEVITEVHDVRELKPALESGAEIIGINNRNLSTLKINNSYAKKMLSQIPKNVFTIVESGIYSKRDIDQYKGFRVHGFLVGTSLMRSKDIAKLIKSLKGK